MHPTADYVRVVVGLRIDVVVRRWTSSVRAPSKAGGVVTASRAMEIRRSAATDLRP